MKLFRDAWHQDVARKRSQPHPEVKAIQKNASLEKLRQTLDEIDAIQSGRSRTNREPLS
jgi:hypothetical protein